MYCKHCGKQLNNNARFCDRCGHNVGKPSAGNRSMYGQDSHYLQEKRSGYDKYQKYKREQMRRAAEEKRRKIRSRRIICIIILLAVVASVITGIASYIHVKNHSDNTWKNTDGSVQVNATASAAPSVSPQPSQTPELSDDSDSGSQGAESVLDKASANKCKIYTDKTMNFTFPYPENFAETSISGSKTKYSVKDPEGDGTMMILGETINGSTTAKQIMKDYASGVGTSLSFNRAGDNWYSLAFERNGKYNYRKGIILNGQHIYYDFVYESSSAKRSEYDSYIKYIDEYLSALLERGSAVPTASSASKTSKSSQSSGSAKPSSSSTAKTTSKAASTSSPKNTQE